MEKSSDTGRIYNAEFDQGEDPELGSKYVISLRDNGFPFGEKGVEFIHKSRVQIDKSPVEHPIELLDIFINGRHRLNLVFEVFRIASTDVLEDMVLVLAGRADILRKVAKEIDWPRRPDGSPDDELKDYSPFEKEFPESLQQQIKDNHEEFERFISELAFSAFFKIDGDGESPFRGLEKTKWDTVSQSEFKSQENDLKENEKYKDMTDNFPMCYMVDLGEYKQGRDVYYTGYYYTKIDGKYYFVAFDTAVGSAGG